MKRELSLENYLSLQRQVETTSFLFLLFDFSMRTSSLPLLESIIVCLPCFCLFLLLLYLEKVPTRHRPCSVRAARHDHDQNNNNQIGERRFYRSYVQLAIGTVPTYTSLHDSGAFIVSTVYHNTHIYVLRG